MKDFGNSNFESYMNLTGLKKIGLTFDVDWAPDFVTKAILGYLEKLKLCATIFCTHSSATLQSDNYPRIERAIHPNFFQNSTQGDTPNEVMASLKDLYPDVIGIRSHSLYCSSKHWVLYRQYRIRYESNLMLPYQSNIQPFYHHSGILRIPFVWGDDTHILYERGFDIDDMRLKTPGLKVIVFHPMNIYMNLGKDLRPNEEIKRMGIPFPELTEDQISPFIRSGPGLFTLFKKFLSYVIENGIEIYALKQLYNDIPVGSY
jgi:hypothetical protein